MVASARLTGYRETLATWLSLWSRSTATAAVSGCDLASALQPATATPRHGREAQERDRQDSQ